MLKQIAVCFLAVASASAPRGALADGPKPFGAGKLAVGTAVAPGIYRSTGRGTFCYWELRDAAGDIVENHLGLAGGFVNIGGNAVSFESQRCGGWTPLNPSALPALPPAQQTAPKSDGAYIVGLDMAPGLWKSDGKSSSCYWERSSLGMEINDNHFGHGGGAVMLRPGDFQFYSRGCGKWSPLDASKLPALSAAQQDANKPEGRYVVGLNLAPGQWQSTGAGGRCYWEKLNAQQDIAANYLGVAPTTVVINPGEFEFGANGCGSWVKVKPGAAPVYASEAPSRPAAAAGPACPSANVCITAPKSGLALRRGAKLVFTGSANAPTFVRYQFQAKAAGANDWGHVADFNQPVTSGKLMEFVTLSVPPGAYVFRLQVIDSSGNAIPQKAEVAVTIQ